MTINVKAKGKICQLSMQQFSQLGKKVGLIIQPTDPYLEDIMITSTSAFLYYNDLLLLHWLYVVVTRSILPIFLVFLPDAP